MDDNLRSVIQQKYGGIASASDDDVASCSCPDVNKEADYIKHFSESYDDLPGYVPEADLGLGCGLPTAYAGIKEGDFVLDLGSGAGNDSFVARAIVGETGYVAGIDFTEAMVKKARKNARSRNISNVDFILGDIENIPVNLEVVDVVISNCVLNLVADKAKAFSEIYRVLKPNGHFCISDVVTIGQLPEKLRDDAAMYAGCVSGALPREQYLNIIADVGFQMIEFNNDKRIDLPDELLSKYYSPAELQEFKNGKNGIFSITISATKPAGCTTCACGF